MRILPAHTSSQGCLQYRDGTATTVRPGGCRRRTVAEPTDPTTEALTFVETVKAYAAYYGLRTPPSLRAHLRHLIEHDRRAIVVRHLPAECRTALFAIVLASALEYNGRFQKLDLSDVPLDDNSVTVIASVLRSNHTINEVAARGAGLSASALGLLVPALRSSLRVLDLSGNEIADPSTLTAFLHQRTLQTLAIGGCFGAVACRQILEALGGSDALEVLDLSATRLGPEGSRALAVFLRSCKRLRSLDLSHSLCEVAELADALPADMAGLRLAHVPLSVRDCVALSKSLCNRLALTALDVSGCLQLQGSSVEHVEAMLAAFLLAKRRDAGAGALARPKGPAHSVTAGVSLVANDVALGPGVGGRLASMLRGVPTLERLELSSCGLDASVCEVVKALPRAALMELDLSHNSLDMDAVSALALLLSAAPRLSSLRLTTGGRSATELRPVLVALAKARIQRLDLGGHPLNSEDMTLLSHALTLGLQNLRELRLEVDPSHQEGALALASACCRLRQLVTVPWSHTPTGSEALRLAIRATERAVEQNTIFLPEIPRRE
jgi:Ran GTPase-activating protein (RanGAP) involved in mRNA processing and transport